MKQKNLNYNFIPDSKKGISIMIGYVLLITFAVIMGTIIYQWMKTYVQKDSLDCPDDVSVFIKDVVCEGSAGNFQLNLTLKNSGMFNIAGYFIHAANETDQELATIDLSQYIVQGGTTMSNAVVFDLGDNEMKPNQEKISVFDITEDINSITIIPVRFQTVENKKRFVSCSNSKIKEEVSCGAGTGEGAVCGNSIRETGEGCDDGDLNNGDGCSSTCSVEAGWTCTGEIGESSVCTQQKRIIFVSSVNYNGAFGGTSEADTNCSNLASAAGLSGTFKAWLSNSTKDIRDYILPDEGVSFYRTDDIKVADNAVDLLDGALQNQININEFGGTNNTLVWTGTNETGHAQQNHCSDWTSLKSNVDGLRGNSTSQSGTWTDDSNIDCSNEFAIYCFQISGY